MRQPSSVTVKLRTIMEKSAKLKQHGFRNTQTHVDIRHELPALNTLCNRVFGAGKYKIARNPTNSKYRVYYIG